MVGNGLEEFDRFGRRRAYRPAGRRILGDGLWGDVHYVATYGGDSASRGIGGGTPLGGGYHAGVGGLALEVRQRGLGQGRLDGRSWGHWRLLGAVVFPSRRRRPSRSWRSFS